MPNSYTYRDPILSLWQAAVAEVHRRRVSVQMRMADSTRKRLALPALDAEDQLMSPARLIGAFIEKGESPEALLGPTVAKEGLGGTPVPVDCAKIAAQFLWAEMAGNKKKSKLLAAELKCAVCDVAGWSECVTVYTTYKLSLGKNPYRANQDIVIDLGTKTKLAIIGDWGTGGDAAINVMQQVATFKPDVLIHLGDIYYAGTQIEAHVNFLDICQTILGNNVPLFSLCGNHDMYSGGGGYYWLLDQIGQQASYFCLQNANWQFLGVDTGNNDNDPLTVVGNMTSLPILGGWSESDWHLNKITNSGGRRNALLSHHPLFSAFGSVGNLNNKGSAYNPNLLADFQTLLPKIDWWFWGHEHTLAIYDPYMGLERGRCVGASAVPVFIEQQAYSTAAGLQTLKGIPMPTWNAKGILNNNGTDYNNCFAIMTLTGAKANVDYYQVPVLGTASRLDVMDSA